MKRLKRISVFFVLVVGFVSCVTDQTAIIRTENRENLAKLEVGTDKAEVLEIMGTETKSGSSMGPINNPYRTGTMKGNNEEVYEILYYYTDVTDLDGAITDDELTPLVLEDGKLIGWGWSFIDEDLQKLQVEVH